MTTGTEISGWFDWGVNNKQRYMLVYCDTFDYSDYPVYAKDVDEFWKVYEDPQHSMDNMQELMEVYDLLMDRDCQLDERRVWHFPERKKQ